MRLIFMQYEGDNLQAALSSLGELLGQREKERPELVKTSAAPKPVAVVVEHHKRKQAPKKAKAEPDAKEGTPRLTRSALLLDILKIGPATAEQLAAVACRRGVEMKPSQAYQLLYLQAKRDKVVRDEATSVWSLL